MDMTVVGRKEMTDNYKHYVEKDHKVIKIRSKECIICNQVGFVEMFRPDYISYRNEMEKDPRERKTIQEILPDYKRSIREQLINGTHPICGQKLYGQYDCNHNFVKEFNSTVRCCEKCELWEDDQLD